MQLARHFLHNDEGKLHGEQKTSHPSGTLHTSIVYDKGDLHGLKSMWDQNGNLLEEANYVNGKLNGRFFEKAQDGKEIVFHYKDNRREGLHEVDYPSHEYFGRVKALEINFVNDVAEGEALEYNEAGIKIATTPYLHGAKEGVARIFSPKGQLMMSIEFHGDKRNGPSLQYYPDGKLFVEGSFVDDLKQGEEKTYFENGKLAKSIPYKKGNTDGLYKEWTDQGVLTFEAEFKDGKRHGKFNKFFENGKPYLLQTFADDELHGVKRASTRMAKSPKQNSSAAKKSLKN